MILELNITVRVIVPTVTVLFKPHLVKMDAWALLSKLHRYINQSDTIKKKVSLLFKSLALLNYNLFTPRLNIVYMCMQVCVYGV